MQHYYTYEQASLLYIAGDNQYIVSGIQIRIDPNLLEIYSKLLSCLYSLSIKPYYDKENIGTMDSEIIDMIKEGVRMYAIQLLGFNKIK